MFAHNRVHHVNLNHCEVFHYYVCKSKTNSYSFMYAHPRPNFAQKCVQTKEKCYTLMGQLHLYLKSGAVIPVPTEYHQVHWFLSFPIEKSSLLCVNGIEIGEDPGKTWSSRCVEKKFPLHTLSCFAHALIVLCTPAIDRNGRQHNSSPFYRAFQNVFPILISVILISKCFPWRWVREFSGDSC